MVKILLIDDEPTNSKILGFHIKNFLIENGINEYIIDEAMNGYEAFGMHCINRYDILMLDVRMPKFDGIKLLNTIRKTKGIKQPSICMVTSLGEEKYKALFRIKKANTYIIKPFGKEAICSILTKLLEKELHQMTVQDNSTEMMSEESINTNSIEESFDFDYFDSLNDKQDEYSAVNLNYVKVNAKEFLEEHPEIGYALEDLEAIDETLYGIIDTLDESNFDEFESKIILVLEQYIIFLSSLDSFSEVVSALVVLKKNIGNITLSDFDEDDVFYIVNCIIALFEDLTAWKEHVCIKQDTDNVFYANASLLSNCMQLEEIIAEK